MQEDQIKIPERIKGFSPVVFFRISNDFSYRRAYCPPRLRRAARCAVRLGCSFFVIRQRTNRESGPRRLIPLGTPQRVLVSATLSLRATRRDATQLQRLRARLKKRPRSLQGRRFLLSHRGALRSPVTRANIYYGEEGGGAPLLAGAILWDGARPFPYMVRRSCPGYAPVSSLKVFEGL